MLSFIENILTGVKMWTDEHKQNKLTAGDNIKINGDTISATNDNSWREIKVNDHTFLSSATTSGSLTLSAGTNVVLTDSNGVVTINSQGGGGGATYSAGSNIDIDNTNHIISAIGYTFDNTTLSFSESVGNTASGSYAHAEGYNTNAVGGVSHAEGQGVASVGSTSHAEGGGVEGIDYWKKFTTGSTLTVTSGSTGATINKLNVLLLSSSTSKTVSKLSIGDIIIYEGASVVITDMLFDFDSTSTTLVFDRPWHNKTFSNVDISTINNGEDIKFFVFRSSVSLGAYSHIEGEHNIASGRDSHAEGNWTKAIGDYSHAEGSGTTASGLASHAEGGRTTASGNYSHASGLGTIANRAQMTAIGKYNKEGVNGTLFAVGNGVDSANTSNAFTVHSGGSFTSTATVNGVADVYLGCPIGTIVMWAGSAAPSGWSLCDGYKIQLTPSDINDYDWAYDYSSHGNFTFYKLNNEADKQYINLLNVIKMSYGFEGGPPFNMTAIYLPNLQEKFPLGKGASNVIGSTGGTSAVTLTSAQSGLREHTHSVNFVDQELYKSTTSQNRVASGSTTVYNPQHDPTGWQWTRNNSAGVLNDVWDLYENNEDGQGRASRHIIETSASLNATESHNNMPPYLRVNYIIKYM